MNLYKRPELDTENPPGQIVNRLPAQEYAYGGARDGGGKGLYLRDVIARMQSEETVYSRSYALGGCCHQTVIERCEGCPYGTINS